eukprot:15443117-Alexandrium_andersonii.AAC.1
MATTARRSPDQASTGAWRAAGFSAPVGQLESAAAAAGWLPTVFCRPKLGDLLQVGDRHEAISLAGAGLTGRRATSTVTSACSAEEAPCS